MAFHWLSFDRPPLAELLLGNEKNLSPTGIVNYRILPAGNARYPIPVGVSN